MEKKYLALAILCIGTIATVSAGVLYYFVSLETTLVSLDASIQVTDLADIPISDLGILQLYVGESESLYFRVVNSYSDEIQLTIGVTFSGVGFQMMDGEIGINIDGTGYVGQTLDVPFTLPLGSTVDIGINVEHNEVAIDPGMTVTVLAE